MILQELFESTEMPWVDKPAIGWWLDSDPVTFYHGTNARNLQGVLDKGIFAPTDGPTANWVSLALDPKTSLGYASMTGGESSFRDAGKNAKHVPTNERVVFVIQLVQSYFLPKMAEARGNMDNKRTKLSDEGRYREWVESKTKQFGKYPNVFDLEYYALTEIRLPKHIPVQYIKGYMFKR